jgi:hypothetical protein
MGRFNEKLCCAKRDRDAMGRCKTCSRWMPSLPVASALGPGPDEWDEPTRNLPQRSEVSHAEMVAMVRESFAGGRR